MSETGEEKERVIGSVLVVGAGVAGIRAALDLAEVGYRVVLTDASPAIGGILAKLGWEKRRVRVGGARAYRWSRPPVLASDTEEA